MPIQRELWPYLVAARRSLALVLEGLLYWRRQTGGRLALPRRDGRPLGPGPPLRAAGGALLVALASPTIPRWVDRLNVLFLLDVSDSVSLAARENAYRFAAQAVSAHAARRPGGPDRCSARTRSSTRRCARRRGSTARRPRSAARGTNLAQALQLGLATAPPGHANRFVLLTDGRQNAGNALAVAQAAKDAGADIYYVPAPLTFPQEVVVESMVLPHEVKFGEPFQAKVVAWSQADTQGRLSLFRNGEFLGSQVVRLTAGKNVYTYRQSLEQSGIHVYQAALEVDGDTIEENNRAVGTVVVRGRPQVLLADKDRDQAQALASALRSQHVDVTVVEPDRIPKDVAGLQKYDGLILSNVSSLKLNKKQMENIRDYVRDHGGGLIMIGGEESFGLGGYYRTPVEEALPVTMEVKQKIEIPSLAVVLSIDRSGSMAMTTGDEKVDQARHRQGGLAPGRRPARRPQRGRRDELGHRVHLGRAAARGPRQAGASTTRSPRSRPAGGTDGYPALKESYQVLFDRPALLKHVIFLSDGQMTRGDFAGLLIRRMAKDKITVSTVAIGKDADVPLMVDVAKWGRGRFYYTEDDSTIPRIFTLETQLASKASAHRAAVQARRGHARPRGDPGDRLEGGAAPRRLRRHHPQGHGGPGADDAPGGPAARHVALRPRAARWPSPPTPRPSGACCGCAGTASTSSGRR